MSAGVLIQWENNEVEPPSLPLCPTGPDGLGWQIRQRIWGESPSDRAREWLSEEEGAHDGTLVLGAQKQGASTSRLHQREIHIVNVRVTDWTIPFLSLRFSRPALSRTWLHTAAPRSIYAGLAHRRQWICIFLWHVGC